MDRLDEDLSTDRPLLEAEREEADRSTISIRADVDWSAVCDWSLTGDLTGWCMKEESVEEVINMLTIYRDTNPNHLPAHKTLLEVVQIHCQDDQELIINSLDKCLQHFPCSLEYVLRYCEILIKNLEEDDLEDSFDEKEAEQDDVD